MKNVARDVRERLKLSQVEFAQRIGMSYASIQNYDRGVPPSPNALQRILDVAREEGFDDIVDELLPAARVTPSGVGPSKEEAVAVEELLHILRSGNRQVADLARNSLATLVKMVDAEAGKERAGESREEPRETKSGRRRKVSGE